VKLIVMAERTNERAAGGSLAWHAAVVGRGGDPATASGPLPFFDNRSCPLDGTFQLGFYLRKGFICYFQEF
jgi:hypothetical protein